MSIDIKEPWARAQNAESGEAAGFATFFNHGPEPDRLVGATTAIAGKTEIWGIRVVGPGTRMRHLEDGLKLPVGMPIELKPRGYHLFFQSLGKPLVPGQTVAVTLQFEKGAAQTVELLVKAEGPINRATLGHA
ncbi:MAG: copper chaperone PCu(A)C [Proteobacteria bacterium]|nr:copper chaperone PCu(A)C [Pseudomonadota bacterium]